MAKEKKARKSFNIPADESKADKFRRLARQRVPKAVKAISNIGNLAGSGYEYTDDQAEKVLAALSDAVANVKVRFSGPKASEPATFDI